MRYQNFELTVSCGSGAGSYEIRGRFGAHRRASGYSSLDLSAPPFETLAHIRDRPTDLEEMQALVEPCTIAYSRGTSAGFF